MPTKRESSAQLWQSSAIPFADPSLLLNSLVHSKGLGQVFAKLTNKKQLDSTETSVDEKAERPIDDQLVGLTEREIEFVNARRALRLAG